MVSCTENLNFHFGQFQFLPARRLLLEDGQPIRLGSRAMEILAVLLGNAGSVVATKTLIDSVWPDTVVDCAALRVHMAALRKTLGHGRGGRRIIVTITQRGYSFVAPVVRLDGSANPHADNALSPTNVDVAGGSVSLVGREEVEELVAARLSAHRCVTVVGTGGVGKTALARAVANRLADCYPGGVHFVDLSTLGDERLVARALVSVLNIAVSAEDAVAGILEALLTATSLVLFDNCEHVVAAVARLAELLLIRVPSLHILSTSREPLRIRGEWAHRLHSLSVPPVSASGDSMTARQAMEWSAIRLFVERAGKFVGDFEFRDADAPLVVEICRRVDGIPLAIELAAGRVAQLGLRGLARRLDDRLKTLARGWRNAPPRHQTLRATLDWSHDQLDEESRLVLRRVSVFKGVFSLESARDVCGRDALEGISDLAEKSLVAVDGGYAEAPYRLLFTTREYALEKLAISDELDLTFKLCAYHCDHLLVEMQGAHQNGREDQIEAAGRRLDDIRAAIDWAFSQEDELELGLRLTINSSLIFWTRSLVSHRLNVVAEASPHHEACLREVLTMLMAPAGPTVALVAHAV